jgi:4-hydroxyphenylacetate 3-monooxygenase
MRTGKEYLDSLNDGRTIIVDGEAVGDVRAHPAFAGLVKAVADLYDIAADPTNGMQVFDESFGRNINVLFTAPKTREELATRRKAVQTWAESSHGWLGRSPDHVGSFLVGFASKPEVFGKDENHDYAQNLSDYAKYVIENDLYVTYAIIPPQFSRSSTQAEWGEEFLQVGVVRETEEGLIVRGSQMLATGAPATDELFVSCIKPLKAEDAQASISFALPTSTKGLKFYDRRPYALAATSVYDYPLTSQFDEADCVVVFDDVLVPWSRVFINQVPEQTPKQFFNTPAHLLGNWQAQIRLAVKLRFIASVAHRAAQINHIIDIPSVKEKLGEIGSLAATIESAVLAAEYTAEPDEKGTFVPGGRALYSSMALQSQLYPKVLHIIRELAGGGALQTPSSVKDLTSETTKADVAKYFKSIGTPAEDRIKLFKLLWDITGSEFGGRHEQYEMFYAGAPFIVKGVYAYNAFGWAEAGETLDKFLGGYGPDTIV